MDRNFDGLSHHFKQQIYGTVKGQLRLKMLDLDFTQHIPALTQQNRTLRILDAGGGMGQFSSALAAMGHHVTLIDVSAEMIEHAQRVFSEVAPQHQSEFHCAPLQAIPDLDLEPFDIVLNHAVLEWLEDPKAAVELLNRQVCPGGYLSLMFYNRHSIVWRNLVNGSWARASGESFHHKKNQLMPQNPQEPESVRRWLTDLNLEEKCWRGIRCVHDHMPRFMRENKTLQEFVEIETRFGVQPPYRDLGRYVHFLFQKNNQA